MFRAFVVQQTVSGSPDFGRTNVLSWLKIHTLNHNFKPQKDRTEHTHRRRARTIEFHNPKENVFVYKMSIFALFTQSGGLHTSVSRSGDLFINTHTPKFGPKPHMNLAVFQSDLLICPSHREI